MQRKGPRVREANPGPDKSDDKARASPLRPFEDVRRAELRSRALRRDPGPRVELRGASRIVSRLPQSGHGFRSACAAFRTPCRHWGTGRPDRLSPTGRPPCAFAFLPRSDPAPRRHPVDLAIDRRVALSSLGFVAVRHMPGRWIRVLGEVPPLPRVTSGVFDPLRDLHHRPSRRLTASERPSASLLEAFSSRRAGVLSDAVALLAFHASCRALLREACGRRRLQGLNPGANTFGPPEPPRTNPR